MIAARDSLLSAADVLNIASQRLTGARHTLRQILGRKNRNKVSLPFQICLGVNCVQQGTVLQSCCTGDFGCSEQHLVQERHLFFLLCRGLEVFFYGAGKSEIDRAGNALRTSWRQLGYSLPNGQQKRVDPCGRGITALLASARLIYAFRIAAICLLVRPITSLQSGRLFSTPPYCTTVQHLQCLQVTIPDEVTVT